MLVVQSCPTLCDSMDCSLPGCSLHEIFQARLLECVAILFSQGSSQTRDWTRISCISRRSLYHCANESIHFLKAYTRKTKKHKVFYHIKKNKPNYVWRKWRFFFSLRGIFQLFTSTPRDSMIKWKWSAGLVKALHWVVFGTFPIAKTWNRDLLQMTYERAPRL